MYLLDKNICIYIITKKMIEVLKKIGKKIFIYHPLLLLNQNMVLPKVYIQKNKISLTEFLPIFNCSEMRFNFPNNPRLYNLNCCTGNYGNRPGCIS